MNFDWGRYLDLAKQLETQGRAESDDEALLRCSMSRAYYAAFCTARNLLVREGHSPPPHEAHWYVYNEFEMSQDQDRRTIGAYLKTMLKRRKHADYDNEYAALKSHIDMQLAMAEQVIDDVGHMSA